MAFVASSTEGSKTSGSTNLDVHHKWHSSGDLGVCHWTPNVLGSDTFLPRRGFACNTKSGKGFDCIIFGGESEFGFLDDLWVIQSLSSTAKRIKTSGDGPSARSEARAILVGNAYIVFGGSSSNAARREDSSLHLLNTMTTSWTTAQPNGPKPSARFGHSFTLVGTSLFVFGGRPSGRLNTYASDLWSFNINSLFSATSNWMLLSTDKVGPCARTDHSAVTHDGKLYIFGGFDGTVLFNDVWIYDPVIENWTELIPWGYTPRARKSHSSIVAAGMMYVFGGIGDSGETLGDFVALNLTTSYWHRLHSPVSLQWPPARSNFAMTLVGSKVFIIGGDVEYPRNNDTSLYVADINDIQFPLEKVGFYTTNSKRARQLNAGTESCDPTDGTLGRRRLSVASDGKSMIPASGSRSISSIKDGLVRELSAVLATDDAQRSITRIYSKVRPDSGSGITVADIRSLDKYSQASAQPIVVNRPSRNSNSFLTLLKRAGSMRRHKSYSSQRQQRMETTTKNSIEDSDNKVAPDHPVVRGHRSYRSIDLERFLALERSMYAELPKSGTNSGGSGVIAGATNAPLTQSIAQVSRPISPGASTAFEPLFGRLSGSAQKTQLESAQAYQAIEEPISSGRSLREKSKLLHRLWSIGTGGHSRKNSVISAPDLNRVTTDVQQSPVSNVLPCTLEEKETRTNASTGTLIHAISVFRSDMLQQKKKLVAERDSAIAQATHAEKQADARADLTIRQVIEEEKVQADTMNQKFQEMAQTAIAKSNELLELENKYATSKLLLLESEQRNVQLSNRFHEAESTLSRYVTIEEEAAELALRQTLQLDVIERISSQIGFYQQRASEAEAKLERETLAIHDQEKTILRCHSTIEELQLKVSQSYRNSSLMKFKSENASREAEDARSILQQGLYKLIDARSSDVLGATVDDLEVHSADRGRDTTTCENIIGESTEDKS